MSTMEIKLDTKNLKRIAYIIFSTGGVAYGLYFSQLVQSLPPAPWWLYLLRSVGVIVPLPHVIPSAIGMCLEDEPGCGPVKSTVPITFRWCTRGDDNSHLTRASVEMAHKILVEEGHTNIRLQIVTDECFRSNGHKVKSHIAMAKERRQIGSHVDVVVVPDCFVPAKGTRKKGRALWYAALGDKIICAMHTFEEHAARVVNNTFREGPKLVDFLNTWLAESIEVAGVILALPGVTLPENKPLGEVHELAKKLLALPDILRSLLQQDNIDFTPLSTWQRCDALLPLDASSIAADLPSEEDWKKRARFADQSAGVMHLDEESIVTKEFISGVNTFANEKQNIWRLGQGAMSYADTYNRKRIEFTWGNFQARWCQMMDSIRRGDDAARFYFQYKCLNKIVFGAKGSFLYLPQVMEQNEKYSFDGGEATSITEDACLAFNMGPAVLEMRNTVKKDLDKIIDAHMSRYEDTTLLRNACLALEYHEDEFEQDLDHLQHSIALALRRVGMRIFEEEIKPLAEEMRCKWKESAAGEDVDVIRRQHGKFVAIAAALASSEDYNMTWFEATTELVGIENELQSFDSQLKKKRQSFLEKEHLVLKHFVSGFSEKIDAIVYKKICGVNLGLQECGWISGELYEQSPFSFWEYIIQRRRWFTGLQTLIREHEYIFPARRFIFSMAMNGWGLMPLTLVSFVASFLFFQYAMEAIPAAISGWMFSTYLFLYIWGWLHQLHDSMQHRWLSLLLLPFVMVSGLCIFESVPTLLARLWPDLNFELVEKNRGLDDLLTDRSELYLKSYTSLKNYELYLDLVGEFYELYLEAVKERCRGGREQVPVPFEVFLDSMPTVPTDIEKGAARAPPQSQPRNPILRRGSTAFTDEMRLSSLELSSVDTNDPSDVKRGVETTPPQSPPVKGTTASLAALNSSISTDERYLSSSDGSSEEIEPSKPASINKSLDALFELCPNANPKLKNRIKEHITAQGIASV